MNRKLILSLMAGLLVGVLAAGGAVGGEMASPGMIVIDSLEDKYEPVNFDHSMHTFIAEGCSDCHHEHQSRGDLDCKGCHAIGAEQFKATVESGFMACSMCHMEPDPETPATPGLMVAYHKKCFGCHRDMGEIGKSPEACANQCHARK